MKYNRSSISAAAWALISIFAYDVQSGIEAASYLQGRVFCTQTGLPLDSVRVASTLYASDTRTDSAGMFTLARTRYRTCEPETLATGSFDEYRVHIGSGSERFTVKDGVAGPAAASLFDLRGRLLQKAAYRNERTTFPARGAPAGVYIVNAGDRIVQRVLVTDNNRPGAVERKHVTSFDIVRRECPAADTIYFCKNGYTAFAAPAQAVETASTITLLEKRWSACDLHNHTVLTDGGNIMDSVAAHSFGEGGLDVLVNSEHGGSSYSDTDGVTVSLGVPRWYSLIFHSWPKVQSLRKRYPSTIILQGLEWNCPGHEHASVGFVDDAVQPAAIAEFEYRFDADDYDVAMPWLTKANDNQHANALTALAWLQRNHETSGYCFVNHPSREANGPYRIEHFRDFHRTAPDVFLGFEGMPGHHKNPVRGSYGRTSEARNRTWGGADYYLAKVGGLWDALLGEGRRLWIIVNSDFHVTSYDFWPGQYAKTQVAVTGGDARAWLDGLKSGEIFITHGDLVSELDFSLDDGIRTASMGGVLKTGAAQLQLTVGFTHPTINNPGDSVRMDHINLIAGSITGIVDPADPAYVSPLNPTTKVLRRFTADDWKIENGTRVIRTTVPCPRSTYFRLRGTSLPVGSAGETDGDGEPLMDVDYANTEAIAWKDLWFYSNPIFVYR